RARRGPAPDLLRRAGGRRARLPVVQQLSRAALHGRRGLARAGRRARHHRGADPPGGPARRDRRRLRGRGAVGDDPGRLVQADREARLPDGADPPPPREAGLAGAEDRRPLLDRVDHPGPDLALVAEAALTMDAWRGQRVLVLGLGRSGRSAARWLAARGAHVVAADERAEAARDAQALREAGVELRTGAPFPDPADFDLVVPSPGVPRERWAGRAHRALGDVERAWRALAVPVVAITGTNGKPTSTELTARLLCAAGLRAEAAGNIGRPALELVGRPLDVALLEVSSFQMEAVEAFRPRVAVVLNLEPDHLDRHGSFAAYADAQAPLLVRQGPGDTAIGNGDDPQAAALVARSGGRRWQFRTRGPVAAGAWWDAGQAVLRDGDETLRVGLDALAEAGAAAPPLDDVLAALLVVRALGADV